MVALDLFLCIRWRSGSMHWETFPYIYTNHALLPNAGTNTVLLMPCSWSWCWVIQPWGCRQKGWAGGRKFITAISRHSISVPCRFRWSFPHSDAGKIWLWLWKFYIKGCWDSGSNVITGISLGGRNAYCCLNYLVSWQHTHFQAEFPHKQAVLILTGDESLHLH